MIRQYSVSQREASPGRRRTCLRYYVAQRKEK